MDIQSKHAGLLVWWLSSDEERSVNACLPPYILKELRSMRGRPLRGRLWVPLGINLERLSAAPRHPAWRAHELEAKGGLVFLRADLELVLAAKVGLVTDVSLNLVGAGS